MDLLEEVTEGYLECAAWANAPEGSNAQFTKDAERRARCDCLAFIRACGPLFLEATDRDGYSAAQFGHDFWLSRCGHGTGFWDRNELEEPPESDVPEMIDRDGKHYFNTRGPSLGQTLTALAYGTYSNISGFAYPSLSESDGWLHFD